MKNLFILCAGLLLLNHLYAASSACSNIDYKDLDTISDIENLVSKCNIKSTEDFIKVLPADLKKRRSLMYKSQGLGFASAEHPRVIYHGFNSYLTITHATKKSHKSFNTIELAQFNYAKNDFDFKFITFNSSNNTQISKLNPRKCMACHHNKRIGKNQLFWGETPFWNGMYGSTPDKYWYHEPVPTPGWDYEYFNGEKLAYNKFIKPKVGVNGSGVFKYLPKDIHLEESHNWFRSGLKPYYTMSHLHSRIVLDSFRKLLDDKQVPLEKAKYYLLYANNCIEEPTELADAYTDDEAYGLMNKFISEQDFRTMLLKVAQKHGFSTTDPKEIFVSLRRFVSEQFDKNYQNELNENCAHQNSLYALAGNPNMSLSCDTLFEEPFGSHTDFHEYYKTSQFKTYHTEANFIYLYIMFNYFDFPYEYVSTADRLVFNGFGANHNYGADLQYAIIKSLDYKSSDNDIYTFIMNNAVNDSDYGPNFPKRIYDELPIANKKAVGDYFTNTACQKIGEKSLIHTQL